MITLFAESHVFLHDEIDHAVGGGFENWIFQFKPYDINILCK